MVEVNRDNFPRNPMLRRDLSNDPEVELSNVGEQQQLSSEINLPDVPEHDSDIAWSSESVAVDRPSEAKYRFKMGTAVMLVASVICGFAMQRDGATEQGHPSWKHVSAATAASDSAANRLVHVDTAGVDHVVSGIQVSYQDADRGSMRKIRTALLRRDVQSANQLLEAAQQGVASHSSAQPPDLATNTALLGALRDRGNELFEIFLFDCCAEDGDIVEVLVNDVPFSTIPITHQGSTVSVPLHQGVNSLTIRGVADGGGGITVGFRTSRGDFYSGSMSEGQDHRLGVIVK